MSYLWLGRGSWFLGDEWDFLSNRSAGSLNDLFRPHNQHWSTLPILAVRLLWQMFGIRTHLPYLFLVVFLHLTIAALLRVVMVRARVSPWLATVVALIFALFGSGYFNIFYAFQIGFCGSLVFGLTHLLLVDHDGRMGRRDALGLLAGLAGLMCSSVGITMVLVVFVAVLIRRGVRSALVHVAPLGLAYLAWFVWIGHQSFPQTADPAQVGAFVANLLWGTFLDLGHIRLVGGLLILLLVVGAWLRWHDTSAGLRRARFAATGALLAGSVMFAVVTGVGRATSAIGSATSEPSRYVHVMAALLVPGIAMAADALVRRVHIVLPAVLLVLLFGVPANVALIVHLSPGAQTSPWIYRSFILTLPRLPAAQAVPSTYHPDVLFDPWMTMGWLLSGVRSGRIPPPPPSVTPQNRLDWTLGIALEPDPDRARDDCETVHLPAADITVSNGQTMDFIGRISVTALSGTLRSDPRTLGDPSVANHVTSYWPMVLSVLPEQHQGSMQVCGQPDRALPGQHHPPDLRLG